MARLTHGPIAPSHTRHPSNSESSRADLTRLLARLQQTVLHADAEREGRLRASEYERSKAEANLEYARSLLTRLEHDAATAVKVHTRRADIQADLNRKRDLIDQVAERLRELDDTSIDSDDDEDDDGSDDEAEDLLAGIVQPVSAPRAPQAHSRGQAAKRGSETNEADDGLDAWGAGDEEDEDDEDEEPTVLPASRRQTAIRSPVSGPVEVQPPETPAATATSQELRPRQTGGGSDALSKASPPESSTTTARAELLGTRRRRQTAHDGEEAATTATTEAILDNHRLEQDRLTASLVSMATSLKKSSQAFASSLEDEKGTMDAAAEGLQRNESGLDAAARRMGRLRRAAEGRGWLGRVYLYAYIAGLSVFALLLVFVLPKLRF